jgi:hypothetical protein
MESLLDEEEVLLRQTEITAEKGYKFWSDRWIALNVLHEFLEAVVVGVPTKSLVVEEYGCSARPKQLLKRAITFYLTGGSRSNFNSSFRMLFSLKFQWNPYSMKSRSCRARVK